MSRYKTPVLLSSALALAVTLAYGSAIEVRVAKQARAPAPEQVTAAQDAALLVLTSGIYDPTRERLALAETLALRGPTEPGTRFIVQFDQNGFKTGRAELERAGARISGYLPHNAYLVTFAGGQEQLRELAGVRFAGAWEAVHKLAPDVTGRALSANPGESVMVNVIGFEGESERALAQDLRSAVPAQNVHAAKTRAGLPRLLLYVQSAELQSLLPELAAKNSVAWIELYTFPHHHNVDSVGPIQGNAGSAVSGGVPSFAPIWARGLTGTGQVVAVTDSGMDRNEGWFNRYWKNGAVNNEVTNAVNTTPPTPGQTWPNRKVFGYFNIPSPSPLVEGGTAYDDNQACSPGVTTSFHGTHTSGTTVGDSGTAATDQLANYNAGDGMAPNAQILFQDIGNDSSGCLSGDSDTDMWIQARNAGAYVSSNSYGSGNSGAYNSSDAGVDRAAYLAQDLLIAFSAGNDGPGPNSIGHPAHSKNALTVGALGHGNSVLAASFSSRGPTSDGRRKPDIQAPGSGIISAGGNDNDLNPPSNPEQANTANLSGTSMSAPTVAGGALLMRQYFYEGRYPTGAAQANDVRNPLGAEMKAVLLNGTAFIATTPDNIMGWGRMWLDNNLFFGGDTRDMRVWGLRHEAGLRTGEQHEYRVQVNAGTEFRATLVWHDPPGTLGAGAALVNNLDLEVLDGQGTLYRGNNIVGAGALANSVSTGTADVINPVEQVRFTLPTAGVYTVRVKGTSVPGSGISASNRQGYGLAVASGTAATAVVAAPSDFSLANQSGGLLVTASAPVSGAQAYQVYRAVGTCANANPREFQYVGTTSSGSTLLDNATQGGFTYAYRIRGVDNAGEGPVSACKEVASTQPCTLVPNFNESSATVSRISGNSCGATVAWTLGTSSCPSAPAVRYNVYRDTNPLFTPAVANKIATVTGGSSFVDVTASSLTTYYYAVRAEDSTTGNLGPNGGNETNGIARLKFTPSSLSSVPGTFADGADSPSFIELQSPWYLSNSRSSAGTFSYHNALPGQATYAADTCAAITTPVITLQANAQLSYKARFNMELNWDGVVSEISTNGGATWTTLPPTGGFPATLSATGNPPVNACAYPATQGAFTGSTNNAFASFGSNLASFAGQSVRLRWRFTSDPGAEEEGFYLDEVSITNASTPGMCLNSEALFINGFE